MRLRKWMAATLRAAWRRTATVNLIVTHRCDLACSYCRVHGQGHAEISPQQWLAIARTLARRYAVFTVTGGEPLLYRGLPELVAGLSRLGIVGLCTNVRTLREEHLRALPGLDYLNFSIDHSGDSTASPKDAFGKFDLLRDYSRRNGFRLFGTAVITARNVDALPGVVRLMAAQGIPLNLQLVQRPGPEDAFDSAAKLARLGELQDELLAMKHGGYPIAEPDAYIRGFVAHVEGRAAVPCHAGETYLAIDSDGRPMPCQDVAAVGDSLVEGDIPVKLAKLPAAVPEGCRCWWNCYHWYGVWKNNPLAYLAGYARDRLRVRRRLPATRRETAPG